MKSKNKLPSLQELQQELQQNVATIFCE